MMVYTLPGIEKQMNRTPQEINPAGQQLVQAVEILHSVVTPSAARWASCGHVASGISHAAMSY
jgi:hypothetical protein